MKKVILISLVALLVVILGCTPTETPPPVPLNTEQPEGVTPTVAAEDEVQPAEPASTPQAEAPPATPTAVPTEDLEPVPPSVLNMVPAPGEEQPLDAPIEITFDQPMDRASVEKAFAIEPGATIDGTFEWVDDQTVRFSLKEGLARGERYRVRVAESATSQTGLELGRPFELRFNAVGFLEVANTQPAPGATEILPDSSVIVSFNRPVVPLGAVENAGSLPDPLTFVPPVTGEGEWLNTSIYQFTPDEPGFAPATEYTARVAQGLTDVSGQAVLADDYEWTFTTVSPAVVGSIPAEGNIYVSPTPVMSVTFNQAMDRQSVEENLLVLNDSTGEPVAGQFAWAETGMIPPTPVDEWGNPMLYDPQTGQPLPPPEPVGVETVTFTPSEPLALGSSYQIVLPAGVQAAQPQAEMVNGYSATFTVSPAPAVVGTNPANGEQFADIWQGLDITFSAPMNPASLVVGENLTITPAVSATQVYTYWSQNDTQLNVSFPRQENTEYAVTLGADVEGRYGQPLGAPVTIRWKTLKQSPYVYLVSPSIATYNAYAPETYVYMTVRNVGGVNFELYRLSPDEFMRLSNTSFGGWTDDQWTNFQPDPAALVGSWNQTTNPETYVNYVYRVDVSRAVANDQPLPPGLYFLTASAQDIYPEAQGAPPDQGQLQDSQVLIISQKNITVKQGTGDALAWVTDLQSGQPVADVPVTVLLNGNQLTQTQTDQDGLVTFTFEQSPNGPPVSLLIFSGDPAQPDDNFAVGTNSWNAGIGPFDFSNLYSSGFTGFRYGGPYNGYIYTERPLYRPGQTVYFKGIVRADDDAHYSLPLAAETAQVQIFDSQGREVLNSDSPLNEWGTFNGSLQLSDGAALGPYSIQILYEGVTFYGDFQVAAYRRPEFLVTTLTGKTEYRQGETINVTVETEFFAGGPVSNAQVRWTLLAEPYFFQYQGPGFYDFVDTEDLQQRSSQYYAGFGERIADGEGVTDAEGRFTFEAPADIANRLASQTFTFDVVVTDVNDQEVANQVKTIVHKGDFYVGLRPAQYVGQVGQVNPIEVLVVDWDSQPVPNQEVELVMAEHNWYSVQQLDPEQTNPDEAYYWENIVETVAVFTTTVTTDEAGQAVANVTPEQAGNYKIYARAIDSQGQEVRSATFLWVSGDQYVNWGQENNDRIELVADQRQYNVGDTANILVPHPFSGTVTALVTLERGHVYEHFLTELETNSDQIQIPITEDMIPNMYVSVVVVKGMDEANPLPGFKVGYAPLPINPVEKTLNITLTPAAPLNPPPEEGGAWEGARPGDTVAYQVKVTDVQGQPVKAELSLALIDKAVLTLAPDTPGELLDTFWYQRLLNVQTSSGLTLAIDRINRSLDEKKGGGGGDGGIGPDTIRQNFADTALWVADFVTDEQGQGTVEATLPDNLTTWVLIAKGVTGAETKVGESRVEVVSSKPLLVRPVTPRFFVAGDQVQLGMIIQNNSDQPLEVEPSFVAEGLTIAAAQAATPLELEAGERVRVDYNITVENAQVARLTMGAKSAEYGDAVAFELPIYHLSTPETVATVGVLEEAGTRLEGIALPRNFDPDLGNLMIQLDPSLAAGMSAGLDYLQHFPYECTEQTVSRFLPNIFTYRAYQQLGLERPELAERLPAVVSAGLQRLYSQQHMDGGWGWWAQDSSQPVLTAYVLLGLVEARRADFAVDQLVIDNAVAYLNSSLTAPTDIAAPWQGNQQAFILYTLAEAGSGDLSRSVALFDRREQLDIFGRAYLAMAMQIMDDQTNQIETLLNDISSAAIISATGAHWEEAQVDTYAMNTDTRSTAIVVAALSRIQPDHPILPQAVRWLMTARDQNGHWGTTQETAWSIIGLTDWLAASGELQAEYAWQVSLNGQELEEGTVDAANLDETRQLQVDVGNLLADTANRLAIDLTPSQGEGEEGVRLYYAAYLTYYKPVQEVKALDRGIIVSRQYSLPSPSPSEGEGQGGGPISEANVGDFIQVRLTLVAPNDLHYVVVEDPFPAGAEAVDISLATTSVVSQQPELIRTDRPDPWSGDYGRWYFSHTELRDEKAVLFATYLPKGTYEYTYTLRASVPGEYHVLPTQAEQMYFPEVFGRSDGGVFTISQ